MSKLLLMLKDTVLSETPLEKTVITVGRAPTNDIPIDNLAVSGFHAKIINENGVYIVQDLNSTNGTFVNERRIARHALNNNDVIMIGKHSLVFSEPREEEDPDATQSARRVSEETVLMAPRPLPTGSFPKSVELLGGFTVIDGPVEKRDYPLPGRLSTIGKSENAEIRLKGFFAPRVAALINRGKEGYSISPPAGSRKVLINGIPVEGRQLLKPCDVVDVWKVKLQFYLNE